MKLIKPKAIIFDWDNTLVDAWYALHEATKRVYEDFGKTPMTFEESKQNIRRSLKDVFPEIFGNEWKEASKRFYEHYFALHLDYIKPLPGAVETLEHLKNEGVLIGVVSNKKGDTLRKEVERFNWNGYFKKVIGSLDTPEDKPSAVPALDFLDHINLKNPSDAWFIGDTEVDMECANNAGCVPIFFGSKSQVYQNVALTHKELLDLFRKL